MQRKENYRNLIIRHLHISSVRNEFEMIAIVKDFSNFSKDIFLISESKLDSTFPNAQFKIAGFEIFIYYRNKFGEELLLYVSDKLPSKFLNKN